MAGARNRCKKILARARRPFTAIPGVRSDPLSSESRQVDPTNNSKTLDLNAKSKDSNSNSSKTSQATEPGSQNSSPQSPGTQHITPKTTTVAPQPLTEFTLFPKLAKELQLRIWQHAVWPRTVSFIPGGGTAPGTLSACRDSRNETRKLYRLLMYFPATLPGETFRGGCTAIPPQFGVFINYADDVIYWREATWDFHNNCDSCFQPYSTRNQGAMSHCFEFFPLWSLPARRILFELPRRSLLRSIFLPTERSWNNVMFNWVCVFAKLPAICPMLQEIILVPDRNPKLKHLKKSKLHPMVLADDWSNRAYLAACDAFESMQLLRKRDYPNKETFDFKDEKEAARYIMDLPDGPRDLVAHWWATNPVLTFVKIKKSG